MFAICITSLPFELLLPSRRSVTCGRASVDKIGSGAVEEIRSAPGKKWSGGKSRLLTVYHNQGLLFNVPQDSLPLYWQIVCSCTVR